MGDHYTGLFAAYGTLVLLTLALVGRQRRGDGTRRGLWPACERVDLPRPWLDVGLFFVAAIGVITVGQLYMAGWLLPTAGPLGWLAEAANQALIFASIPLLLILRRQGPSTALLSGQKLGRRALAGVLLAAAAIGAYIAAAPATAGDVADAARAELADGRLLAHAVQVFMEDLAVAVLLVRLAAALRSEWAAGVGVALLFAGAHIPAMLAGGDLVEPVAYLHRGLDATIGVVVMVGLLKTRDLLWLFPTHLALDLTQFAA
ncbi:MAG: hypothetical protein ACTS22_08805 [Phycisphaerales bacterium]